MLNRDKALDKVRKLIAYEESARSIGSIVEAAASAVLIQNLLYEHDFKLDELEEPPPVEEPIESVIIAETGRKQRIAWKEDLADDIATSFFSKILVHTGSDKITFVGTPSNAQVAMQAFKYLCWLGEEICKKEYRIWKVTRSLKEKILDHYKEGGRFACEIPWAILDGPVEGIADWCIENWDIGCVRQAVLPAISRSWKRSFMIGYGAKIGKRLKENRHRLEQAEVLNPTALVYVRRDEVRVSDFVSEVSTGSVRDLLPASIDSAEEIGTKRAGEIAVNARAALPAQV